MMNPIDEFTRQYSDLIEGTYDCVDRIILNGYFPLGYTGGGMLYWWQQAFGTLNELDTNHCMRMAGKFSLRLRRWAKKKGVPVIYCKPGDRKHEMAHEMLPADPNFQGLFAVFISRAPGAAWTATKTRKGGVHLEMKKPWPHVNHYSFHIIDREWGHLTIKMCGHPPYGAQIMLNGHEWVERRAKAKGVGLQKQDNCFTAFDDAAALSRIADTLLEDGSAGRLAQVCDRWIYSTCLCFGLSSQERERLIKGTGYFTLRFRLHAFSSQHLVLTRELT